MDTLERIIGGDEKALEELLQDSWAPLVRYLAGILRSRDQAMDAAQDAFVRLWAGRDNWRPGSATGLLFRLGRNAAMDIIRKERVRARWARRIQEEAGEEGEPFSGTPEEAMELSELSRRFMEALGHLPQRRREVFELVRFRGLSYDEVAETLTISRQTVANQMTRAHKDLRRVLADLLPRQGGERGSGPDRRWQDG